MLLLQPLTALAFTFELEAPADLRPMLQQHLEVARAQQQQDEPLAPDELQRLLLLSESSARELLATEGYFSPTISSDLTGQQDAELRARLSVSPGPRTIVRELVLDLTGAANEGERQARMRGFLLRDLPLREGMPFRQADWSAAKQAVLRPLHAFRYPAASLEASEARIDADRNEASLLLRVDSGPAFSFGELQISGLQRYPESIVRNLSSIRPGDTYSQQAMFDLQRALVDSGYFTQAQVRMEPDPAQATATPVEIEVVEQKEKRFSFGAGISTDTGPRVSSEWMLRNLRDRGLRLTLEGQMDRAAQQGSATLAWPKTPRGREHSLSLQHKREDIEGQETRNNIVGGRTKQTRGDIETTIALQYQEESQYVGDEFSARNQALTANYIWTRRHVGRAVYPRRGYILTLQGGGANECLLTDTSFLRLYARHTQNFPLGNNARLVLRGEAGGVFSERRDGIPTDFLFRAGGDTSIRGYAYQSIGRDTSGAVQSVRYLGTASIEYHRFFTSTWGGAVFVDAGDATDQPAQFAPVFGYGFGMRYASPVGPINLDLAWGEATRKLRLHFTLGVTF
ncbi:MAG: outer membrane protein assembly factor [Candidatus Dactylopiibacterium carminicum]|nr:MAG: outer membrane protein assembly factor [Candidatus Dactylopiibacterium carminicum]